MLRAEGVPFEVQTPSGGVRLVSERNRDDGHRARARYQSRSATGDADATRNWGSRMLRSERAVKERTAIDQITEDDLLEQLFEELRPWLG